MNNSTLQIEPDFQSIIPPLSSEEYAALEQSLLVDGCRDALVVWGNILIDGHNRYELCLRHNIPFSTIPHDFESREDAMIWICQNQLARRNISDFVRGELALKMKGFFATRGKANMSAGWGRHPGLPNLANPESVNTREELAEAAHISHGTIHKVENILENAPETVRQAARRGDLSIHRAYQLTKALHDVSEGLRVAALRWEITDPQLITLLEQHKNHETTAETLASGRIQYDGADDPRDRDLADATAWDFQGLLRAKQREYRLAGIERKQDAQLAAIQHEPQGVYSIIYADPPWQYDNSGLYGAAERHYPTMTMDELCRLPETIHLNIADNAVLFLWATNPLLPDALRLITAWGFQYKTNLVWDKGHATTGLGFYVRGQHELLLIATHGATSWTPKERPISVIREEKTNHSSKPKSIYSLIECMYPNQRYIELFSRGENERKNWDFWGAEIAETKSV